jgi:hypothetical protein
MRRGIRRRGRCKLPDINGRSRGVKICKTFAPVLTSYRTSVDAGKTLFIIGCGFLVPARTNSRGKSLESLIVENSRFPEASCRNRAYNAYV